MKKLLTFITITAAALMLSSCIIVGTDEDPEIIIEKKTTTKTTTVQEQPAPQSTTVITSSSTPTTSTAKHNITCYNNTSYVITDWCVKRENIFTYANSTNNRMIVPNGKDSITDLPEGRYQIFFSFDDCYQLQPCNYSGSEEFELRQDITYILSERSVSICKSARAAAAADEYPILVLSGSDGSEIELIHE